jgi:hypothetical protein
MSFAGENLVHSWTSDGGTVNVVPFLKASPWNFGLVEMSPEAVALMHGNRRGRGVRLWVEVGAALHGVLELGNDNCGPPPSGC